MLFKCIRQASADAKIENIPDKNEGGPDLFNHHLIDLLLPRSRPLLVCSLLILSKSSDWVRPRERVFGQFCCAHDTQHIKRQTHQKKRKSKTNPRRVSKNSCQKLGETDLHTAGFGSVMRAMSEAEAGTWVKCHQLLAFSSSQLPGWATVVPPW
jgi:hypothetical protein